MRSSWSVAIVFTVAVALVASSSSMLCAADRLQRRAEEMALPDEYLDPQWPATEHDSVITPEESDSVENVPIEDEQPDAAESEELQRNQEALGIPQKPDDFSQDNWGQAPGQVGPENEDARDPAKW